MKIRWTKSAVRQLTAAYDYVAAENREAADHVLGRIMDAVRQLAVSPQCGREGRIRNTRELVVVDTPYLVAYRVKSEAIHILAILHGRRRWPQRFQSL